MSKEILEGVKLVEKEKGIEPGTLLAAIEDALLAAYRKMPDARHPVRVDLDRDTGDFTAWTVTDDAWTKYLDAHPHHHVLAEAPPVDLDPTAPLSEEVSEEPEPEIEWDWFNDWRARRRDAGQLQPHRGPDRQAGAAPAHQRGRALDDVRGVRRPRRRDRDRDRPAGRPPLRVRRPRAAWRRSSRAPRRCPGERYEQGSRIKAVIIEVRAEGKGPQVVLSRRSDELIRQLFELEVPEIADGLVNIRAVAREPGYRAKIAVESRVQGVDPVGACVGPRGSRVRMVVSELRGEKIDIIPWNDEPARFVAKALAPAKVREVYVDDDNRQATVVVPDGELSLAIGKEGLNARLAHRLTGWRIDIVSETEYYADDSDAPYTGADGEEDEFPGRCIAVTSSGKRCPNQALDGSRYCGVPAHVALAAAEEGHAPSR